MDGVRISWNQIPRSQLQHQRNVVPLGVLYTPMYNRLECPKVEQPQLMATCRQCQAFINPYCRSGDGMWSCVFCGFMNRLVDPQALNLVLGHPGLDHTTIEYSTGRFSKVPPVYLFVVDTCFEGEEDIEGAFQALKDSINDAIAQLPSDSLIGLITYGQNVQIHEISSAASGLQRQWTFSGAKKYTLEDIQKSLGILDLDLKPNGFDSSKSLVKSVIGHIGEKFLVPIENIEYELNQIIANVSRNVFPHSQSNQRMNRCNGSAINIASLLLKAIIGSTNTLGGHIYMFIGGICTYGPGQIVGQSLKEPIRSHHDIERQNQTLVSLKTYSTVEARKFYGEITERLVSMGISCSLLIGSYDQVGLFEMESLVHKTGGDLIMCDLFDTTIFKQSLVKLQSQQLCLNGTLEVRTSPDLAVQGLLGNASRIESSKKGNKYVEESISKLGIGESDTNCWKCCNVGPRSTYALYFEKKDSKVVGVNSIVQFIFHYQPSANQEIEEDEGAHGGPQSFKVRVTTIAIPVIQDNDYPNLEYGFDQETALVLIAREIVYKLQAQESRDSRKSNGSGSASAVTAATAAAATKVGLGEDVVALLDKKLIDFCVRFAGYTKNSMESFSLSRTYSMLPQFLYHLRRSQLVRVFNNSPDETSYVRHLFLHEDLTNSLTMIQPTLLSYDVDNYTGEPEPVLLDSISLGSNKILLLDTFLHVLIFHGSKVAQWRKAKYHEQEGYEYFKEFLEAPKKEAMEILIDRFPLPRFIDCDEGGSQARFLMAKLNPSTSYSSNPNRSYNSQTDVLTDDTSLQLFMEHVQKIVVTK